MKVNPKYLPFETHIRKDYPNIVANDIGVDAFEVKTEERDTENYANPRTVVIVNLTLHNIPDKIIVQNECVATYLKAEGYNVGTCIQGCIVKNFASNATSGTWIFDITLPEKKKSVKKPSKPKSTRVNKTKEG